jgi:hypothetical protein
MYDTSRLLFVELMTGIRSLDVMSASDSSSFVKAWQTFSVSVSTAPTVSDGNHGSKAVVFVARKQADRLQKLCSVTSLKSEAAAIAPVVRLWSDQLVSPGYSS